MSEEVSGRVRVVDVKVGMVRGLNRELGVIVNVPMMQLLLEDGRTFEMYHIPYEIAQAIVVLRGEMEAPARKSVFDLLIHFQQFRDLLARHLREVTIDEIDEESGLYTATAVFEDEGLVSRVKMIPSHAVFLALLVDTPIYVSERLVRDQSAEEEPEE